MRRIDILLVLMLLPYSTEQTCKFKISPSASLTTQEFANQTGDLRFSSTCEVTLLSGNHSLSSGIKISSVDQLSVQGEAYTNVICSDNGRFEFENILSLSLNNLNFINCEGITISSLDHFSIENCTFFTQAGSNTIVFFNEVQNASIISCSFRAKNNDTEGEDLISCTNSTISLSECVFTTNHGRLLFAKKGSNVIIRNSVFCDSTVTLTGDHPALMKFLKSSIVIVGSTIRNNRGSLLMSARNCPQIEITDSSFVNNAAWKCTICVSKSNVSLLRTSISENSGNLSVVYLVKTDIKLKNGVNFSKNNGSFLVRSSIMTFDGINTFEKCIQRYTNSLSENYHTKGTLTVIQSTLQFHGTTHFLENYSDNSGGAMYVSESVIQLNGNLMVAKNIAKSGGGAFFYLTQVFSSGRCFFTENRAENVGGGIHAVSTTIILRENDLWGSLSSNVTHSLLNISDNEANNSGGGMYFEVNSKLYGIESKTFKYCVEFARNKAIHKGGAIYVNDSTYPGVCSSKSFAIYDVQTECFFQALHDDEDDEDDGECRQIQHINFDANSAEKGSILYGGLLDRCTVSFQASVYNKSFHSTKHIDPFYGLSYFQNEGGMNFSLDGVDNITSDVLRICFCQNNEILNCDYKPPSIYVKKGETFNISVAAVDQVNKSFNNVSVNVAISSYLNPKDGGSLANGQLNYTHNGCKNLSFKINSCQNSIDLVLYIDDNPCEASGLSRSTININFEECSCPIGFQDQQVNNSCECACHEKIKSHVHMCNSTNQTFQKTRNSWIGYLNESHNTGYLVYPNCPYDFCLPPTSPDNMINLNLPNGADVQCAYNRAGLLCGRCKENFQLSLGTPSCIDCSNSTSTTYVLGILVGGFNGILIVGLFLILNLTVAQGTFNGLLFYANILLMSRSTFLPSMKQSFFILFINFLNIRLGLDRCYPGGIDEYLKLWHSIVFPLYMLFLVVAVIMLSKYSSKCARLIGKRNPVATLATIILLMYTEILQMTTDAFSFAILKYPNGSPQILWRPDASVKYFRGKHIPLFLTAVVIMIVGTAYTFLLFTWQWLTRAHNKYIFRWIRNTKLISFMDAYHAPYKPKYRYWTGLLLLVRIVFNVAVTANTSGNPNYNLLIIIILIAFLILLKTCLGDHIYKQKLLDYIENICLFNLLLLSILSLQKSVGNPKSRQISTRISVSVSFVIFLCVLLYHIQSTLCKTKCYKRMSMAVVNWIHRRKVNDLSTAKDAVPHYNNSSTVVSLSNLIECSPEKLTERCTSLSNPKLDLSSLREPLIEES